MSKHKAFKNITETSADFYVYGDIVDEKYPDWFTGEISATEVDVADVRAELEELKGIKDLNIYINSGGGSVFASSAMVSLLRRFKQTTGAKIHSYIDGLCASAATYLAMVADDINVYQNSIMMIHKPMTISMGNADDLQKDIDTLDTIENDMMIPLYMNKSKVSENEIKELIAGETWFGGNPSREDFIGNYFNINYLDEAKQVTASASKMFRNYKHIPEELKKPEQPKADEVQKVDYSSFEDRLSSLKKGA